MEGRFLATRAQRSTMKTRIPIAVRWLLLGSFLALGWASNTQAAADKEAREDADGFKEFSAHVQEYVRLHKAVESTLPQLKTTDLPEMIAAHQQALARKIREARPDARQGKIFTHEARRAFKHAIRNEFQGPEARQARATVQQENLVRGIRLQVNQVYPVGVPYTIVPPTLLQRFPTLPNEVAYRIADRDLVLLDVNANMVVDVMREAVPGER